MTTTSIEPEVAKLAVILLVEDNPGDVLLTRKAFEKSRIANKLHVVNDGEAALDFLYKRDPYTEAPTPDLILLDINLPKLSGTEVLRELKDSSELCQIPVVMLTSSSAEHDIAQSYAAHANSYITKPPNLKELRDAFASLEKYWFAVVTLPPA